MNYDETLQVEIDIRERVPINISIQDIMYEVNALPLQKKWSCVANIINNLHLTGKDSEGEDVDKINMLNDEQKLIVKKFLKKQLTLL